MDSRKRPGAQRLKSKKCVINIKKIIIKIHYCTLRFVSHVCIWYVNFIKTIII